MVPESFRCYLVKKTGKDQIEAGVERRPMFELPAGEVLLQVTYSSVNYKDALATIGHPGVTRRFPHVPGIDAAGTVVESSAAGFAPGDQVLVTSYELGVERWGGWAEYVRVPAEWVIPLPDGLTLEESMILGTAGLTAALCVRALKQHGVEPESGEVVVTGASGGVGSLAVILLAQLGYRVAAVSGKSDRHDWLRHHGAATCLERDALAGDPGRPLLSTRWAGAIDTVGGETLGSLLRSIKSEGCVACCGMAGGAELATTVYPFILRGITLAGIDSAWCSMKRRQEVWSLLAGPWKPVSLQDIGRTIGLDAIRHCTQEMLAGHSVGRAVVDVRR